MSQKRNYKKKKNRLTLLQAMIWTQSLEWQVKKLCLFWDKYSMVSYRFCSARGMVQVILSLPHLIGSQGTLNGINVNDQSIEQDFLFSTSLNHSLGLCSWCLQDSLAYFDHIGHRPPQFLRHEKTLDVEYELALICSPCRDQEYIWTCYGLLVLVWYRVLITCKWPLWSGLKKQNVHFAFGCLSNHLKYLSR